MITRKLLPPDPLARGKVITFSDHTLLSERTVAPYSCPEHIPGPGILTMLSGSGRYGVNREVSTLDSGHYLLINQNSPLTVHLPRPDVQPLLLFFRADTVRKRKNPSRPFAARRVSKVFLHSADCSASVLAVRLRPTGKSRSRRTLSCRPFGRRTRGPSCPSTYREK